VRCVTRRKAHARNHTRLSALNGSAPWPHPPNPSPSVLGPREPPNLALIMKIERFAGHHEAREALVLSIAGVTAIMLIECFRLLLQIGSADNLLRAELKSRPNY
jgi:hypothetical protein